MLTDVPGFAVGHWTDQEALTGCTVVLAPPGTIGSGEVRGGAPASREFALLDPIRTVATIDAVVLSGGSAFGLAAADGVMAELEAQGRGFETSAGSVPIVVGMSLFDLAVGDPTVRPGPEEGRSACRAATSTGHPVGRVGAGTGATVGKWSGQPTPAGIGAAAVHSGSLVVAALIAVNAYGFIDDGTGGPEADTDLGPPVRRSDDEADNGDDSSSAGPDDGPRTNTTIGVIATNGAVDKIGCQLLAQSGHDGLARSLLPAHTAADGDALVALATGEVDDVDLAHLRLLAQTAVVRAVRSVAEPGPVR